MPRPPLQELTGVYDSTRWRAPEGGKFVVGFLACGTVVCGDAEEGQLLPGITYQFWGRWDDGKHGKQFKFKQFTQRAAATKHGVVNYLMRHAPGIGPGIGAQLWDAFGEDAVKMLRVHPELAAAATRHLTVERALIAAKVLETLAETEETKIALTDLFAGRGFPGSLVDACIERWGLLSVQRIKRDPFCLLVAELPGCGFARCDRLYHDLGLDMGKIKRQVICLWHVLNSDTGGNTWLAADACVRLLGQHVSGAVIKAEKAVAIGVRSGWLATREDAGGRLWFADGKRAENETYLAERIGQLTAVAETVAEITAEAVAT